MSSAISDTTRISKAGDRGIVITREFDAPPALVFRAYTAPDLIPKWWGPRRLSTTVDVMDARPGGSWRFVQHDDEGNEFAFHGVFHTVVRDRQIAQTFEWEGMPDHVSLDTTTFEAIDGRTRITAVSVFQTPEDRDGMMASDMEVGVNEGYERIDELLLTLQ
jgi:uncharacterized protein YndB with AHSA1/START domain